MNTEAVYLTRTSDLAAFRGFVRFPERQLLVQELMSPRDGGELITGIQKLAQKVLILLLTVKGSKKYRPKEGTYFMRDAMLGLWRTSGDVRQSFLLAKEEIREQLKSKELPDDPPDECFATLKLDGIALSGDKVSLNITLLSQAGDQYKWIVPIKVNVR